MSIRIAQLCKKFDVYLIFDEVMTGFGRTGRMFAMDRLGVIPDLICLSKGLTGGTLPLAVTIAREEVYSAFLAEDKSSMFFHGHSFTGNPISCAAAVANLKIFRQPDVLQNLERIEMALIRNCNDAKKDVLLIDARVCGSIAALEIDAPTKGYLAYFSERVFRTAIEKGLFIRPLGNVVYLLPTFCSSIEDLDYAWQTLRWVVQKELSQ